MLAKRVEVQRLQKKAQDNMKSMKDFEHTQRSKKTKIVDKQ